MEANKIQSSISYNRIDVLCCYLLAELNNIYLNFFLAVTSNTSLLHNVVHHYTLFH